MSMIKVSSNAPSLMDLAHVIDKNKDNKIQLGKEIELRPEAVSVLDSNQDQVLSTSELSDAIAKDHVIIEYKTSQPAQVRLNPAVFRTSTNDPARGTIYAGGLLGAGAGAGIGALVALGTGAPASSGAQLGGIIGALSGTVGGGVYSYFNDESETTISKVDPTQEPDPKVVKKYTMTSAAVGAGIGAAAGGFGLARLGVLDTKTSIFIGTTIGATMGMFVGNIIGTNKGVPSE